MKLRRELKTFLRGTAICNLLPFSVFMCEKEQEKIIRNKKKENTVQVFLWRASVVRG